MEQGRCLKIWIFKSPHKRLKSGDHAGLKMKCALHCHNEGTLILVRIIFATSGAKI